MHLLWRCLSQKCFGADLYPCERDGSRYLQNCFARMNQAPKFLKYLSTLLLLGKLSTSMSDGSGLSRSWCRLSWVTQWSFLRAEMRQRSAKHCTNIGWVLLLQEEFADCCCKWGAPGLTVYSSKISGCLILSHHSRSGAPNACDDLADAAWLCLHWTELNKVQHLNIISITRFSWGCKLCGEMSFWFVFVQCLAG